jgi:predicted acylesterase/phospholipase RssA
MSAVTPGPRVQPSQVRWLSLEGGGAAGMTVHPGTLHALEDLKVLQWDGWRQVKVEGFAGSSSGSILATLASCGYHWNEIAGLLSPPTFDLIFRTETLQLGDGMTLYGRRKQRVPLVTGTAPSLLGDPMAYGLAAAMYARFSDGDDDTWAVGPGALLADVKAEAVDVLKRRIAGLVTTWATDALVSYVKANYPEVIAILLARLLDRTTWKFEDQRNLLTIMRYDYGFYAGHKWREFLDLAIAFARFRVQYGDELGPIDPPGADQFRRGSTLEQVFCDAVRTAEQDPLVQLASKPRSTNDYVGAFMRLRGTTFRTHRQSFFDPWLSRSAPGPLAVTGANLNSAESHIFSFDTTPDMMVADAVRISSGLPPVFKPFDIAAGDIPSNWNVPPDGTDPSKARPFLEGLWMDGGTFHNSPMDWYRPYESSSRRVLGVGIGIPERRVIEDVSDYYWAIFDPMARSVYERNIAATRVDFGAFIQVDNFGIGIAQPTMSEPERQAVRLDAWKRTVEFLGGVPRGIPAEFAL